MNDSDGSPLTPEGQHPAADKLADFAEGTLPFEDVQQIRRHLEVCPECHHLIRDLSSYPALEPPSEPYKVSAEELRTNLALCVPVSWIPHRANGPAGPETSRPRPTRPNRRREGRVAKPPPWRRSSNARRWVRVRVARG